MKSLLHRLAAEAQIINFMINFKTLPASSNSTAIE
jgi:hypothetical protein